MLTEIIMPKAGMDMQEGEIIKWNKNIGDPIKRGEIILEIMTDKVSMEVEAEEDGFLLHTIYGEGDVVPVITTIGYIGELEDKEKLQALLNGSTVGDKKESTVKTKDENAGNLEKNDTNSNGTINSKEDVNESKAYNTDGVRATPAARQFARENNVDLEKIEGSGPNGRIHKDDVEVFVHNSSVKISPLAKRIAEVEGYSLDDVVGSGYNGKIMKSDLGVSESKSSVSKSSSSDSAKSIPLDSQYKEVLDMSPMRKVIAKRMSESFFSAPTFTLNVDVDMSKSKELVKELRQDILDKTGSKLTITDFITFVVGRILIKHDMVNASLSEDETKIFIHNHASIALAVDIGNGLVTPVIKNCDKMSLSELVATSKELVSKAQNNRLKGEELAGSTLTISNLGMLGIKSFNPIINQPNSAIMGISAMIDTPVVRDGNIVVRPIMNVSLTVDHRVIDGAVGARFLSEVKDALENPYKLFI